MGADIKKLKNRIRSVSSTMHITKAMELVASSKIKTAAERLDASRPYSDAVGEIIGRLSGCESPYTEKRGGTRVLCIMIAGDRGLAGGYNNDIFRLFSGFAEGKEISVLPIGKRALDFAEKKKLDVYESFPSAERFRSDGETGRRIAEDYADGKFDGVYVIFTKYVSALSHTPSVEKLLPIEKSDGKKSDGDIIFEPDEETVFAAAVPEYLSGKIYGAVCESFSSELSARRNAMDSATKNAGEMIDSLSIKYNRARQGAITQEITEIIGGSETQ